MDTQLFFDDNAEVKNSEGKPVIKNTKKADTSSSACHQCFELRSSISQLQNDVTLKIAESKQLNTLLNSQKESLQKDFEGAVTKTLLLEEQLIYKLSWLL